MESLLLMLGSAAAFIIAYNTYGKFLAKKIFKIRPDSPVPSKEKQDGIDYVPSKKGIIFGHHFTSIAGTGPIVGPAIGIIYGWIPALLWVVFGSIFLGAVHDFSSLVISLRNEGKSLSEITAKYINERVRIIFFAIVFFALLIVIAVFGVVIATVFDLYPESVIAVWLEVPIAIMLGWAVYRKKAPLIPATIIAVILMYAAVALGAWVEHINPNACTLRTIKIFEYAGKTITLPPTGSWTILLLVYAWVASTLPVNTLLQPRDYINAWQLFIMMALMAVGIVTAAFTTDSFRIIAPAVNHNTWNLPPLMPIMFVTIACGAISGFHSLVASGTSPKQISSEPDALFIGFGSMLLEGALAVLVIIAIIAGIAIAAPENNTSQIWDKYYYSWTGSRGLADKLAPVVNGSANILTTLKIPHQLGLAVMGVFIASFAGTTLDTAVRIQRYVIGELAEDFKIPFFSERKTATTIAVLTAAALAFAKGASGTGAVLLWPLFGSVNQLLAALALLVATVYLRKKGGLKFIFTAIPTLIMLVITAWAMVHNQITYINKNDRLLTIIGAAIILLAAWMTIETLIVFIKPQKNTAHKANE